MYPLGFLKMIFILVKRYEERVKKLGEFDEFESRIE